MGSAISVFLLKLLFSTANSSHVLLEMMVEVADYGHLILKPLIMLLPVVASTVQAAQMILVLAEALSFMQILIITVAMTASFLDPLQ